MTTQSPPPRATSTFQRRVEDCATRIDRINDTVASSETPENLPWPKRRSPVAITVEETVPTTAAEQARKFETLGRMLAGIVHDMNNIFAVVGGHAELLSTTLPSDATGLPYVEVIRSSIRHASGLTNRLLSFARPAAESPSTLDLASIVPELKTLIRAVAGSNIECVFMTDGEPARVRAHRDRIEQVILNLVANSRDALPNGGAIGLRTATIAIRPGRRNWPADRPAGPYTLLTVADNGSGIDAATRARIFDPFFTTKGTAGTGLGLATVREIVDLYRGHIEVESDPDVGTIFRIFFPAAPDEEDASSRPFDGIAIPEGMTALLVDDDDHVRAFAKSALESIGFHVIEAADGETAARLARVVREPIDLLVADVVMPGLGGRKLAERLRFSRPGLPVVYISGHSHPGFETEPGTCFVPKPFTHNRFLDDVLAITQQFVTA